MALAVYLDTPKALKGLQKMDLEYRTANYSRFSHLNWIGGPTARLTKSSPVWLCYSVRQMKELTFPEIAEESSGQ